MLVALALLPVCCTVRAQTSGPGFHDEVSYTNDIQPIVRNFCVTCHSGDNPEGEFVRTGYQAVRKDVEHGELLRRINDVGEPMPQNGLMPVYMRRLFQLCADSGFLNRGSKVPVAARDQLQTFTPPRITAVDVTRQGFEMLECMQGHWVGSMKLMGQDDDWMALDYRPIARARYL